MTHSWVNGDFLLLDFHDSSSTKLAFEIRWILLSDRKIMLWEFYTLSQSSLRSQT